MTKGDKQNSSLEELLVKTRAVIASGELSDEEKADLEERCKQVERLSKEERESYDYFLRHMPDSEEDLVLVVLKGHLLLEQRTREFISVRMLSPKALDEARLTSHQAICLAQALTMPNDEPQQFWAILHRVNSLRNQLAHNLDPQGVQDRVREIVTNYSGIWPVKSGFVGVLAHAYSQLTELCRLARRPGFCQ